MAGRTRRRDGDRMSARGALGLAVGLGIVAWAGTCPPAIADGPSSQAVTQQLEQRDALISDLLRHIEQLERQVNQLANSQVQGEKGQVTPAALRPLPMPRVDGRARPTQNAPTADEDQPQPQTPQQRPRPGAVEVDEEAAERALERTLVSAGALLIPFGQIEIEPNFTYTRREDDQPQVLVEGGLIGADDVDTQRDEFTPNLFARIGLPLDSQIEFGVPYNIVHQEVSFNRTLDSRDNRTDTGHAIGDISVGVAKTVLREKGWQPDVVARVTYDSDTGERENNGVPLDGGFHDIRGQLVAIKRQDPLAFLISTSFEHTFEDDNTQPGNEIGLSLGAFLAASPETSLRMVLQNSWQDDLKFRGETINGSNSNQSALVFGASSILGKGVLLDVSTGVGLTDDAPDYFVTVALPIRFDLPLPR